MLSVEDALKLLDRIDSVRRDHYYDRFQDNDGMLRLACGIVAEYAGITSRADWCDMLKADPSTRYAHDYADPEKRYTF